MKLQLAFSLLLLSVPFPLAGQANDPSQSTGDDAAHVDALILVDDNDQILPALNAIELFCHEWARDLTDVTNDVLTYTQGPAWRVPLSLLDKVSQQSCRQLPDLLFDVAQDDYPQQFSYDAPSFLVEAAGSSWQFRNWLDNGIVAAYNFVDRLVYLAGGGYPVSGQSFGPLKDLLGLIPSGELEPGDQQTSVSSDALIPASGASYELVIVNFNDFPTNNEPIEFKSVGTILDVTPDIIESGDKISLNLQPGVPAIDVNTVTEYVNSDGARYLSERTVTTTIQTDDPLVPLGSYTVTETTTIPDLQYLFPLDVLREGQSWYSAPAEEHVRIQSTHPQQVTTEIVRLTDPFWATILSLNTEVETPAGNFAALVIQETYEDKIVLQFTDHASGLPVIRVTAEGQQRPELLDSIPMLGADVLQRYTPTERVILVKPVIIDAN